MKLCNSCLLAANPSIAHRKDVNNLCDICERPYRDCMNIPFVAVFGDDYLDRITRRICLEMPYDHDEQAKSRLMLLRDRELGIMKRKDFVVGQPFYKLGSIYEYTFLGFSQYGHARVKCPFRGNEILIDSCQFYEYRTTRKHAIIDSLNQVRKERTKLDTKMSKLLKLLLEES